MDEFATIHPMGRSEFIRTIKTHSFFERSIQRLISQVKELLKINNLFFHNYIYLLLAGFSFQAVGGESKAGNILKEFHFLLFFLVQIDLE